MTSRSTTGPEPADGGRTGPRSGSAPMAGAVCLGGLGRAGRPPARVAVGLARGRRDRGGAGAERAFVDGVDVIDEEVDRRRHRLRFAMSFAELDQRIADAHRGVRDFAVGHIGDMRRRPTEGILDERDQLPCSARMQEWRHRVIPLGTRTDPRLLPRFASAAAEALHQLLVGDLLLMRSQIPRVAPSILHASFAIAVRLIGDRESRRRAGRERTFICAIDVIEVNVQSHRLESGLRLTHLDERVAQAHHGMPHASFRIRMAPEQLGAERLLQERDHPVGIGNEQIRPDRRELRGHLILHRRNQFRQQS